jgi:hypothetical protein
MPGPEANCWLCCDCKGTNFYALHPQGSACSYCFAHRNVGCCRSFKSVPDGPDPYPAGPNLYEVDFKDFLATPPAVRERSLVSPDAQSHISVPPNDAVQAQNPTAVLDDEAPGGNSQTESAGLEIAFGQVSTEQRVNESFSEERALAKGFMARCRFFAAWACEPRLKTGYVRIRYRCACGSWNWDDYPARLAEQAAQLEAQLRKLSQQAAENTAASGSSMRPSDAAPNGASTPRGYFSGLSRRLFRRTATQRVDAESQGGPRQRPGRPESEGGYYLTCFPVSNDRRPTLVQVKESDIDGDHSYFSSLRENVKKLQRPWLRLFNPRKVKAIRYVLVS